MSTTSPTDYRSTIHAVPLQEWFWVASAIALGLVLRMPFFRIAMVADEGGYAFATRGWVEGTGRLYDDLWISRPQGIFLVYAGIFDLFGTDTVAIRFAAWIAASVTALIIWGFTRSWLGPRIAILAAVIFVVISASPNLEGYTANAEIFMGAPAALAILWLYHAKRHGWHRLSLCGIGVLIGIATSLKPSAVVMFPVAVVFVMMVSSGPMRDVIRRVGWIVLGGSLVVVLTLLHGWYLGWHNFIYATLTYRLTAQSSVTVGLLYNLQAIGRLVLRGWALLALSGLCLILLHYGSIVRQLGPGNIGVRFRRRFIRWRRLNLGQILHRLFHRRTFKNEGDVLLRLWLAGAFVGMSIGGDWWPHYVIQVTAPASIWLAKSIVRILQNLTSWGRRLFAIVVMILLLAPFSVLRFGDITSMQRAMFSHPGYPAQDQVAVYIREHTAPGTPIFVAFDQASIYYVADRPPAYRHLFDQELHGIPGSYTDIISIIRSAERPEYIVGTRQPGPFPDASSAFWYEVGQYYTLETMIDGVPIYRANSHS